MPDERYYNSYRPVRRNSDLRSPDHSNDRYRSDRNGDSRVTSRATDLHPTPRRIVTEPRPESRQEPGPEPQASKMDLERASADVAKLLRTLYDAFGDKIKATNRNDTVLEGFRRRLSEYEKQRLNNIFEPSVTEAYERLKTQYKVEEEKVEKDLINSNGVLDKTITRFAYLLVKTLPINEIKVGQLIENAKKDLNISSYKPAQDDLNSQLERRLDKLSKDFATTATKLGEAEAQIQVRATEDRTQKLQEQVDSLLDSFKAQQATLDKLQNENNDFKAQAADIKARQDQFELDTESSHKSQLEAWKQEKENLESEVTILHTQVDNLLKQNKEFSASWQNTKTELANSLHDAAKSNTPASSIPLQEFRALETQVKQLDETLRDIDAEEYANTVAKLLAYPSWKELNTRIQGQQTDIQRIGLESKGINSVVKREAAAVSERFDTLHREVSDNFRKFSDRVVQKCGELVQDLETKIGQLSPRIDTLEARLISIEKRPLDTSASRAPSFPAEARATDSQGLQDQLEEIQKMVATHKQDMLEQYSAHEMMIIGLDEQFKHMTTIELASIIMDNIKKLPTNVLPLDIQNFHERLADLEQFRQEHMQRGDPKYLKSLAEGLEKYTGTAGAKLAKRKRQELEEELSLN